MEDTRRTVSYESDWRVLRSHGKCVKRSERPLLFPKTGEPKAGTVDTTAICWEARGGVTKIRLVEALGKTWPDSVGNANLVVLQ
mgnify:CR=1 FL=1